MKIFYHKQFYTKIINGEIFSNYASLIEIASMLDLVMITVAVHDIYITVYVVEICSYMYYMHDVCNT